MPSHFHWHTRKLHNFWGSHFWQVGTLDSELGSSHANFRVLKGPNFLLLNIYLSPWELSDAIANSQQSWVKDCLILEYKKQMLQSKSTNFPNQSCFPPVELSIEEGNMTENHLFIQVTDQYRIWLDTLFSYYATIECLDKHDSKNSNNCCLRGRRALGLHRSNCSTAK